MNLSEFVIKLLDYINYFHANNGFVHESEFGKIEQLEDILTNSELDNDIIDLIIKSNNYQLKMWLFSNKYINDIQIKLLVDSDSSYELREIYKEVHG